MWKMKDEMFHDIVSFVSYRIIYIPEKYTCIKIAAVFLKTKTNCK